MSDAEQIVRELAASDPVVYYAVDDSGDDAADCAFCAFRHWDHDPDCLWLKAQKHIQELAATDPILETHDRDGWPSYYCRYCGVDFNELFYGETWDLADRKAELAKYGEDRKRYINEHHKPDCPWLNAKEAVER